MFILADQDNPDHLLVFLHLKNLILSTCGTLLVSSSISMHLTDRLRPAGLECCQYAREK